MSILYTHQLEVANYSSMTFKSSLTLSICLIEPRIPTDILVFINIMRAIGPLLLFIKTDRFYNVGFGIGIQFVFPYSVVNIHPSQI